LVSRLGFRDSDLLMNALRSGRGDAKVSMRTRRLASLRLRRHCPLIRVNRGWRCLDRLGRELI
jgi:hypothetical protein